MILLKKVATLKITTFAVKTFFISLFFFTLAGSVFLFFYSYENLTQNILEYYGKEDKLEIFRTSYLTERRFLTLRLFIFFLFICSSATLLNRNTVAAFLASKIISLANSVNDFFSYTFGYFHPLSRLQKIIFTSTIFMIAAVKWIFLERYPMHIDEIFSYLFFVRKGFLVLISYYPGPNNHIFYSLLAYLLQPFVNDPFYLMKIPSWIASVLASCFFFFFTLRYVSFQLSLLGTLLFSFSINFFYYSLLGRGYVLMTFFTLIAAFMILEIISGRKETFFWHMYVLTSLLAFYSMLGYLYPFISFGLLTGSFILYRKEYALLKPWFYYHTIILLGTLLLYTPVLLVSGLDSLTANPWVASLESKAFFRIFPEIVHSIFDYILYRHYDGLWIALPLLLGAAFFLYRQKRMAMLALIVFLFVTPLLVLLVQHARPFDRVWTYLIFPFSICLVVWLDFLFSFVKNASLKTILVIFLFAGSTGYTIHFFYDNTSHGFLIYENTERISREVVENGNGLVYTNEDVYNLYIRYQAALKGQELVPDVAAVQTGKRYGYILLAPGTPFPSSLPYDMYQLKEHDAAIEVYKLKY